MQNNFTEKVVRCINKAFEIAKDKKSPDVDVPHLLKAINDYERRQLGIIRNLKI